MFGRAIVASCRNECCPELTEHLAIPDDLVSLLNTVKDERAKRHPESTGVYVDLISSRINLI